MSLTDLDASCLTTRLCLVWKTQKPFAEQPRLSPVFTFMDYKWHLKLIYDSRSPASYDVYIVSVGKLQIFPKFSVTIYLENSRKDSEPLFCRKRNISAASDYLWRLDRRELVEVMPDVDIHGDFSLVCFLRKESQSALPLKKTDHKSVQATLDSECGSSSESPSSTFMDLPFSLRSLSMDLENLLDKNMFPDIQLKCGDRAFPAHKSVLAARSEVFDAMFQHELAESHSGVINVEDIDPAVLDLFLKYMYSGKISDDVPEDLVSNMYTVSDKYSVNALKKICSDCMMRNINKENFIKFLMLADAHSDEEFKNGITSFIMKDDALLKSEIWFQFDAEKPLLAIEVYRKYFMK